MSDPVLHIKDAYFFEVPKPLWRHNYQSKDEVPAFMVKAHPDATVEQFNHSLDGKILIPQPFATLKNLYETESGFGISKFMILELVVAVAMILMFTRLASRMKGGAPVPGRFSNFLEAMLLYMRNNVARPAIGDHDADRFVPILWTIFFFILGCNLLGLVPWAGTPTASFATTLALAGVILCTTLVSGMKKFGPVGFWFNQVPSMDLPIFLAPLKLIIFAIEVIGLFIRHAVLAVRLLANMFAGHLVLLGILGLIVAAASATLGKWGMVTTIAVLGSTAFSCLELFVACLQAYIFTFLAALFIGAANHHH